MTITIGPGITITSGVSILATPPPSNAFTLTAVVSNNQTITLPIKGTGLNANIDWGDGNTTTNRTADNPTKTYSTAGNYTIQISGNVPGFGMSPSFPNPEWLTSVTSWGNVGLTSLRYAFGGQKNISIVPNNIPSTVTDISSMFYYANNDFNDSNVITWDTKNITDFSQFIVNNPFTSPNNYSAFNQNISGWNTSLSLIHI